MNKTQKSRFPRTITMTMPVAGTTTTATIQPPPLLSPWAEKLIPILRLDICSHPRDNRLRCALRCRHSCRLRCELRCKLDVNSDVNTDVNSIKKNYIRVHIWVNSPRDVDTDVDTDVDSDVNHFNACCYFPQCYLVPLNNVLQLRQHLSSYKSYSWVHLSSA